MRRFPILDPAHDFRREAMDGLAILFGLTFLACLVAPLAG